MADLLELRRLEELEEHAAREYAANAALLALEREAMVEAPALPVPAQAVEVVAEAAEAVGGALEGSREAGDGTALPDAPSQAAE